MKVKRKLKIQANEGEGYCYLVIYSNGTIKGGKTQDIIGRMNTHEKHGQKLGIYVDQIFVTSPHVKYHETEVNLLALLSENCTKRIGEYFQGVDINYSLQALSSLGFSVSNYDDIAEIHICNILNNDAIAKNYKDKYVATWISKEVSNQLNEYLAKHLNAKGKQETRKDITELALIEFMNNHK